MRLKHALILLVVGYCIQTFGALQKILHTSMADTILAASTFIIIIAWLIILFKLLTHPKLKEFLDW